MGLCGKRVTVKVDPELGSMILHFALQGLLILTELTNELLVLGNISFNLSKKKFYMTGKLIAQKCYEVLKGGNSFQQNLLYVKPILL